MDAEEQKKEDRKPRQKVTVKATAKAPPVVRRRRALVKPKVLGKKPEEKKLVVKDKEQFKRAAEKDRTEDWGRPTPTLDPRRAVLIILGAIFAVVVLFTLVYGFRDEPLPLRRARNTLLNAGIRYTCAMVHVGEGFKVTLYTVKTPNLAPLKGVHVEALFVNSRKATDIRPLEGMPLTCLLLNDTAVSDLTPLKGMPLRFLDIRGTKVTDLAPLEGLSLEFIGLPPLGNITNGMDVLRDMKTLKLIDKKEPLDFWADYDKGMHRWKPMSLEGME